ncbi:hypothetical protein JOB18_045486 [Solea senegalensis]|uniref:Uncharacterized protein n=1 Tax=Solea senegalensis TaxID=28829 RepID=A0AAV6PED2_SOLSE|nr:hypothetical protein JOB18_045486 [Solea senegalensis]
MEHETYGLHVGFAPDCTTTTTTATAATTCPPGTDTDTLVITALRVSGVIPASPSCGGDYVLENRSRAAMMLEEEEEEEEEEEVCVCVGHNDLTPGLRGCDTEGEGRG